MKHKILYGIMAFVAGLFLASCSDDDYSISNTPLLKDGAVVTGSADVTATSATFHGSVSGLEGQDEGAYTTGFYYGSDQNNLSEKLSSSSASEFSATYSGMAGDVVYYQAFVTLQGRLTYTGEVKSTILTDSKAITGSTSDLTANKVTISGSLEQAPSEAESGIIISGVDGTENVRNGVRYATSVAGTSYTVDIKGLLPGTTYYYVAYLDLGAGVVYGDVKSFTTPTQDFDLDNDLVDLGLSTKWARYNVGGTQPSDLGGLYGFGDMTGFNTSLDPADYASADIYKTDRDVANKVYDSKVTIPTIAEFEELFSLCTKEWTTENGVSGYKLTGPNGNSIFLPAAGSRSAQVTTGEGSYGYYLSGSVNPSDNTFALAYSFSQAASRRTTTPTYQALSIRPVSVAKNVKFDKSLLQKTWEIDLRTDGSHYKWAGPVFFYGTDDSWASVTNHQPVVGDSWSWEADYAGNSWVVSGTESCQGTMTFSEADGKNVVTVSQATADGTFKETTGTYTVDEQNKTITLEGVDLLRPYNYDETNVNSLRTNLKILSLDDESMQIAIVRTESPCLLSINYVATDLKNGYTAKLTCYSGDDGDDQWNSATVNVLGGDKGVGTYKVTFNTTNPRTKGQVYVLDIVGYAAAYPNALVRIDSIRADGKDVPFDANKFYYGDIEGNGNYRIEMANIWGKGHNDSWNGLSDTPFQKGGGETTNETALAFNSTFEVVFTVVSNSSNGTGLYTPQLITINPSWGGTWGFDQGDTFEVAFEDNRYVIKDGSFDLTYSDASTDYSAGSIMTFLQVNDLYGYFPGTHATLDALLLDGRNISFDQAKVLDSNESPKYRLELWNMYGATANAGCAFGTPTDGVIQELGFTSTMETKFTFHSLFAKPAGW